MGKSETLAHARGIHKCTHTNIHLCPGVHVCACVHSPAPTCHQRSPVDVSATVVSRLSAVSVCRASCVKCLPSLLARPTNIHIY